jgi:hypothetical protein
MVIKKKTMCELGIHQVSKVWYKDPRKRGICIRCGVDTKTGPKGGKVSKEKRDPKAWFKSKSVTSKEKRDPKAGCKRKSVRSDSKTSAKFVHEIEAKDIGKGFVPCDKCEAGRKAKVINMRDLMGRAQRCDIGKRIYRVGSIYQVENDEQLAKRKKRK